MTKKSLAERALADALTSVPRSTTLDPGPGPARTSPKAALRRCCAAWQRAFDAYLATTKNADDIDKIFAYKEADEAYRNAMPMLVGYEGARDFIARASHGILIGAIPEDRAGQLLYAAQVALATLRHAPKPASIPPRISVVPHPLSLKMPSFDELFPLVTSTESMP